jgi:hypothetical protein
MSQADFSSAEAGRAVFVRKQSANVYTMMLLIAFLAVTIGCIFLFLEKNAYDGMMKTTVSPDAKVPPPQSVGMRMDTPPTTAALRALS